MEQFQELIKKWQSLRITSVSDLDNALDSFKVEFAYNSGKIENDRVLITIHGKSLRTER